MELEPVPVEPDNVNPLLAIFSTELWEKIIDKIQDPKDRFNVANADPLFRNVAAQSKKEDWTLTMFGLALPQLYSHLSGEDVVTLRQLSKGWRNKVDQFLESGNMWKHTTQFHEQRIYLNLSNFQYHSRPRSWSHLLNAGFYAEFLGKLRALPHGKLVGGSVYVYEDEQWWGSEFLAFFREFGRLVHHLKMNLEHFYLTSSLNYSTDLLRNCPNLRTLYLNYKHCEFGALSDGGRRENVVYLLERNPLPNLPELVSLVIFVKPETEDGNGLSQMLERMLDMYAGQLEQLVTMQFSIPLSVPMPRLTHLDYCIWNSESMQSLRNLGVAPLEKLELDFRFDFCPVELFGILEGYKTSLKSLRIMFPDLDSLPIPAQINLPRLESLELARLRVKPGTSLDFLLSFPKLRRLQLELDENFEHQRGIDNDKLGIIKHLGEDGVLDPATFYLSPVWKALPLLNSVVCGVNKDDQLDPELKTHTRKEYEYYKGQLAKMSFY